MARPPMPTQARGVPAGPNGTMPAGAGSRLPATMPSQARTPFKKGGMAKKKKGKK
jgi:hypothetical protein